MVTDGIIRLLTECVPDSYRQGDVAPRISLQFVTFTADLASCLTLCNNNNNNY